MPSVEDNSLYECDRCHTIVQRLSPLQRAACPECGNPSLSQIRLTTVCDFCATTENVRWAYDCEDFEAPWLVGAPHQMNRGEWAACDGCRELIDANDRHALTERAIDGHDMGDKGDKVLPLIIRALHDGFFKHRIGDEAYPAEERRAP